MRILSLFLFILIFNVSLSFSQNIQLPAHSFTIQSSPQDDSSKVIGNGRFQDALFCSDLFNDAKAKIIYSISEFEKCKLIISTVDSNLIVVGFHLLILNYKEWDLKGNKIPEMQKNEILNNTEKNITIEQIKAKNQAGAIFSIHPINFKVQ